MKDEDLKKKYLDLAEKIENLRKEIEKLQKNCSHKEKIIKFDELNNVWKLCKFCNKKIGIPNEKELRDNGFI
jgi:hypothetical protein